MASCCCRLIQPDTSRRKKASGGGSRSIAEVWPSSHPGSRREWNACASRSPAVNDGQASCASLERRFSESRLGRVFAQGAFGRRFSESLLHGRDEFIRNRATENSVLEHESGARLSWIDA